MVTRLGHVNIRTPLLEQSVAFYRDVIGLSPGGAATRPGSRDHVWMSDHSGHPCIHLQRTAAIARDGTTAGLHHVAFDCVDPQQWRAKLAKLQIAYDETEFQAADMVQFNLLDPTGVIVELTFAAVPAEDAQ